MSTTFTVTRDQVIIASLRKLGVIEPSDNISTIDSNIVTNAAMVLNLFIKQCAIEGLKIWKTQELIIPMVANQTTYQLGGSGSTLMYDSLAPSTAITDKPLKIVQAFYRNSTVTPPTDIPLQLLSRQEYNILGSKASTGIANSIHYDVKQNSGQLAVYLTPDSYSAANLSLHIIAQMPMGDVTASTDVPDFPNEWMNCLVWNLADQLAIEFGVPQNHRAEITQRATMYKTQLDDFDVESTSVFFMPDARGSMSYQRGG